MHDCEADPDRDLERRRLGDPLLREKRLPGPVPPGDRAAAAQILEHPRAADRDLGSAGEKRPAALSFHNIGRRLPNPATITSRVPPGHAQWIDASNTCC